MVGIFKVENRHTLRLFFACSFILSACANTPNPMTMPNGDYRDAVRHLPYAAKTPIRDLNIGVKPLPNQLKLLQNPYGTDTLTSCNRIMDETLDLRRALRENFEQTQGPQHNRATRAAYVGEAAEDAVESAVTSFIPFRSAIRYVSGAKKRVKTGERADRLGRQRLGFLIGVGNARSCPGFRARR